MAVIVNNKSERTELQQRIVAELREKQARKSVKDDDLVAPEYDVEKSEYLKNTTTSSVPGWVWLIGVVVIAVAAFFIAQFMSKK